MGEVVSFVGYTPPARYDAVPWTDVQIEEAPASTGDWTLIETLSFIPVDVDPAHPETRSFTTNQGTAPELWYRVIYVDGSANLSAPTSPVQNVTIVPTYATVDELFRVLKLRNPTDAQIAAAEEKIATATLEINAEIDFAADTPPPSGQALALVHSVCIDRAADLWRHTESIPGIAGVLDDALAQPPLRYSWERYAQRLATIKDQWGIA